MADVWQFRRDTAANWTSVNPTLADGELGVESDTGRGKLGDGTTAWTGLGYTAFGAVSSVNGATGVVVLDAADMAITDTGGYFTGTDVEAALQELGAGGGMPGGAYAQYLAASLEPDALETVQVDSFSYAVGSSVTKLLVASWQTRIGSTGRMEVRNPQRMFPMRGVTLAGTGTGSAAIVLDPAAPTYADAWDTYYDRMQLIHELPTRVIPITAASEVKPLLPGPYGAIITQVTCFNLAWVAWRPRGQTSAGINLMNEELDSTPQRVGDGLFIPVSKRVAGEVESSSTSTATGGAASGAVCMVLLPSTWSVIADPVSASYTFRDDFMGTALDTASTWTRAQSTVGNVEIDTTYQWCKLAGNTAWNTNGMYRTATEARAAGKAMVVDIYMPRGASGTGVGMVGWSDATGHDYTDMAHGVNFAGGVSPNGVINVYENGTLRGTVGSGWTSGCIYRVRVTLGASSATYEIQGGTQYPAIGSASWTNITPGVTSSTTTPLTPGAIAYASTAYISDMRVY